MQTSQVCSMLVCNRKAYLRGLCAECYPQIQKMVQDGEATWEQLEGMGLVRPLREELEKRKAIEKNIGEWIYELSQINKSKPSDFRPDCCMVPDCQEDIFTRGLCKLCYRYLGKITKMGFYSWKRLEEIGAVLTKKNSWFYKRAKPQAFQFRGSNS